MKQHFEMKIQQYNQPIQPIMMRIKKHKEYYYDLPLHHHRTFHFQLHEHNRVIYLMICGSRELFGWVLFAFLFINLPININLIRRNIFTKRLKPIESLILWFICFIQIFISFIVLCPLAWCCKVYHTPKKFIPSFQLMTIISSNQQQSIECNITNQKNGWLWYKLKYDDLYQRLLYGPKFAISIGPVKEITYFNSLEVNIRVILSVYLS